jgi:Basic region leucine zipper
MSSGSEFSSSSPSIFVKSPPNSPRSMKSPLNMSGAQQSIFCGSFMRRPRGEKRPIPEEQKDEKYFERRKRNNEAAKKSRDARKMREDRVIDSQRRVVQQIFKHLILRSPSEQQFSSRKTHSFEHKPSHFEKKSAPCVKFSATVGP